MSKKIEWYQRSPDSAYVTVKVWGESPTTLTHAEFLARYVKPEPRDITDYSLYIPDFGSLNE